MVRAERQWRIAQVAPLYESVPPKLYGGTERVVSYLTEALVEMGHTVSLYASGDSQTNARLRPMRAQAVRLDNNSIDPYADHVLLAEKVFQDADEFDIIHSHIDYSFFPLLRRISTPHVTTLHGRLDIPNLQNLYCEFHDEPVVSISTCQRAPIRRANWQATVYHGLPKNLHSFHPRQGSYLAFLGRISPEKGIEDAIAVARLAGLPLKIAAKVDKVDREYFDAIIKPLLGGEVELIGEVGEDYKTAFLGNALALIFMIDWPEPFGLAMIESLACGTPVIARARGSVPEVIEDGKSGYVVETVEEAVAAAKRVSGLRRDYCRKTFENRFTARRMASDYIAVYEQLLQDYEPQRGKAPAVRASIPKIRPERRLSPSHPAPAGNGELTRAEADSL